MGAFITLMNKLNRKDSLTGMDIWYKSIIKECEYTVKHIKSIEGNVVNVGQTFEILIPFTGRFLPYSEWKASSNIDTAYTISPGDYIFLNTVVSEDITPDNIKTIKNKYEPDVCEIKSIQVVEKKNGVKFQIRIEGV